jgi:hypothetical protein
MLLRSGLRKAAVERREEKEAPPSTLTPSTTPNSNNKAALTAVDNAGQLPKLEPPQPAQPAAPSVSKRALRSDKKQEQQAEPQQPTDAKRTKGAANDSSTPASATCDDNAGAGADAPRVSPRLRLPLTQLPGEDVPPMRVVDATAAAAGAAQQGSHTKLLHVERVQVTPLMLRVPDFISSAEIDALLAATTHQAGDKAAGCVEASARAGANEGHNSSNSSSNNISTTALENGSGSANPNWSRYTPYDFALQRNAESSLATMSQCLLREHKCVHALLDRIAARVAVVAQAKLSCVSMLDRILRYEPGQEFMLHKVSG